jgi:magnesium transporter
MNEMYESSARARPELTGDAKQGMVINCAAYQGGCRIGDVDLDQVRKVDTSDGRFIWIGLHEPDQALLHTVQQRFGLHDLAIEDALRAHQRPKLEIYGDTLFIVVRTASLQDRKIRYGETHIFAGRGYVVTVRHGSTTAYKEVRTRCEGAPKMLAMGEGFVIYSIIDFIVDKYFPILQELESEVDALEDTIFSRTSNPHIGRGPRR